MSLNEKINLKNEAIINSALMLFSEKDFHEVMMEEVAKYAGIAKGTLYIYYNSKEELYFTILNNKLDSLLSEINVINQIEHPVVAISKFISILFNYMINHKLFFLVYKKENLLAQNPQCQKLKEKQNSLRDIIDAILKEGIEKQLFDISDICLTSRIILSTVYESASYVIENKIDDYKEFLFKIRNNVLRGICKQGIIPLCGKTIIICRNEDRIEETAFQFVAKGANIIPAPLMVIKETEDWSSFDLIKEEQYNYIIFTSVNAARISLKRILDIESSLDNIFVAAIGEKTLEYLKYQSVNVEILPEKQNALGLLEVFSKLDIKNKKIFLPHSSLSHNELAKGLEKMGAIVNAPVVYSNDLPDESVLESLRSELFSTKANIILFTSPSSFNNYSLITGKRGKELLNNIIKVAIGSTTASAMSEQEVVPDLIPEKPSMESIIKSLTNFYSEKKFE